MMGYIVKSVGGGLEESPLPVPLDATGRKHGRSGKEKETSYAYVLEGIQTKRQDPEGGEYCQMCDVRLG